MDRHIWIDWMRVLAIFLVVIVHSTEPFYLGGEGSLVSSEANLFWVAFFDSFARACVPLFVIASSFLQLPSKKSAGEFFRGRFTRVLIPFIIWTCIYALVWGEPIENFKDLVFNFNYAAGHFWFVYMIIGIYLLIPVLSPWAEKVSKRQLLFYLSICLFTTFIPFIREACSDSTILIYGPGGLPNQAKYPLWGECSWNAYGLFYYFSGFVGYLLLGLYVRRFTTSLSWGKTFCVGVIPFVAGFLIAFGGFIWNVNASAGGVFPVEGPLELAVNWEVPWFYDSFGVALMAVGWIFILKKIRSNGKTYARLIIPVSKASYGIYLCHMFILVQVFAFISTAFDTPDTCSIGFWTTPVIILSTAIITFACAFFASFIIRKIPVIGKWLMG